MICSDILSFWNINRLTLYSDEGFRFGRSDKTVTGIMFCWKPTLSAIAAAHEAGCNLIVTHEELNFPPVYSGANFESDLCDVTFQRISKLSQYDITLFRGHGSLDELCILDAFGSILGFSNPKFHGGYSQRTYEFKPMVFDTLCKAVKERMGLEYIRVCGEPDTLVSKAGLVWGGVGISANPTCVQDLIQNGADVLIGGECEEIPYLAVQDAGVCYIETSHACSENPGLLVVRHRFAEQFQEVPVLFYENKRPWEIMKREV